MVTNDRIVFNPFVCFENNFDTLSKFKTVIDLHDVVDCFNLQLFNETGKYVQVIHKKNYMYDFYL